MGYGDDIPPPPMVKPPAPVVHEGFAARLAAMGAARFGTSPDTVRVDDVTAHTWCRTHRVYAVWGGAAPPRKTWFYVAEGERVVHIAEGYPSEGGAIEPSTLASVSAVLRVEGILVPAVPAAQLAQCIVDVICRAPATVMTARSHEHLLGRGYPIDTWRSPAGRAGADILRECSRDAEVERAGESFRLDFFTIGNDVHDWIVTGNSQELTGAKHDTMIPSNLWPPIA